MRVEESAPPEATAGAQTSITASRLAAQLLDEDDRAFLEALREAGLLGELDSDELLRVATEASEEDPERRRVDLLELYYGAAADAEAAKRRRSADRYFSQSVGEPATAAGLVERLTALAPELPAVELERIGGSEGPLVLRAGEHVAAVLDDYEEETDTDQFDLREAQARKRGVQMVTVRGLVRAINILLDRHDVRERLIALRGDEEREVYVSLGVIEAVGLAKRGYLEDEDEVAVMELGAW